MKQLYLRQLPDDAMFSRDDLRRLLIPLLLEQALNVFIGMMDTMMVAGCGEAVVSGVSLVDSVNVLLFNIFTALATGGSVVISQYLGKKDHQNASSASKMLFYAVLICSTTLMLISIFFRIPLLGLIFGQVEADVMASAQIYFLICAISYPFMAMYNASAALLRSMGNAKASLHTSLVMNIVNVAGNAICIYGFGLGAAGAALGTLASRIVGVICMQFALRSPECLIPCPSLLQLEWNVSMVGKILTVGIPNGLESGMFQFGKLVLLGLVSTFGTASIAANAVGNTWATIQCLPGMAIGLAVITVVGQCIGAGKTDQARYYAKELIKLSYFIMTALNLFILLLNPWVVLPFGLSEETARLARLVIAIHGTGCILIWPLSFILPNSLRAGGDTFYAMSVSMTSMLLCRLGSGWLLAVVFGLGMPGIWIAMQIDWLFRSTFFVIRFRNGKWLTKKLV